MGDLVDEAERVRLAHARPAHEMKPTTRLEKIEIGRLLEQSSSIDDVAAPMAISDEPSVPTVVATLDHLPIRMRVDAVGSDVRGRDPVAKPPRERIAMRALARRAPKAPWLELAIALGTAAWIIATLLGL